MKKFKTFLIIVLFLFVIVLGGIVYKDHFVNGSASIFELLDFSSLFNKQDKDIQIEDIIIQDETKIEEDQKDDIQVDIDSSNQEEMVEKDKLDQDSSKEDSNTDSKPVEEETTVEPVPDNKEEDLPVDEPKNEPIEEIKEDKKEFVFTSYNQEYADYLNSLNLSYENLFTIMGTPTFDKTAYDEISDVNSGYLYYLNDYEEGTSFKLAKNNSGIVVRITENKIVYINYYESCTKVD